MPYSCMFSKSVLSLCVLAYAYWNRACYIPYGWHIGFPDLLECFGLLRETIYPLECISGGITAIRYISLYRVGYRA